MRELIATADTALKASTAQSASLDPHQKISFPKGSKINVLARKPVDNGHDLITLDTNVNGKNTWFMFPPHWEDPVKGSKKDLLIVMTPERRLDPYGGELFRFSMEMGTETLSIPMGSGVCGSTMVRVENDYPGSGNPIPQGKYRLERTTRESEWQMDPAIGPVWIALTPLGFTNGRAGFLIHMDYNFARSPGTLGCPFPQRNRDMYTIADWNDRAENAILDVRYGF